MPFHFGTRPSCGWPPAQHCAPPRSQPCDVDVDLERRELRVTRAYAEPVRFPAYLGPPKSDAGVRTVALPQVIAPVLEEHLDRWAVSGSDGLLFTSERGGPLSRHNRKWWRAAGLQAGLDPRTHLHDLRHAGLTLAARSGATLRELMALAGHSSRGPP